LQANSDTVVLVHGAIIPAFSVDLPLHNTLQMAGLTSWGPYFRNQGFDVRPVAYKSIREGTKGAVNEICNALEDIPKGRRIHILAHSFGGPTSYLALQKFLKGRTLDVSARLVCVGSPFQGSAVARRAHQLPLINTLVRHTMDVLDCGIPYDETLDVEMGAIIGDKPVGGWNSILRVFPKGTRHDGCIAEMETRFDGFKKNRLSVESSHEGMLLSAQVASFAEKFFYYGCFKPEIKI
jgi:hypothetical protein